MKKIKIFYVVVTVLFSLGSLFGAYYELSMQPLGVELLEHLGYPPYFNYILGVARILGVIGICQSKSKNLREWAYAGFVIDFIAAIVSHLAVGDSFGLVMPALLYLVVVLASYLSLKKLENN